MVCVSIVDVVTDMDLVLDFGFGVDTWTCVPISVVFSAIDVMVFGGEHDADDFFVFVGMSEFGFGFAIQVVKLKNLSTYDAIGCVVGSNLITLYFFSYIYIYPTFKLQFSGDIMWKIEMHGMLSNVCAYGFVAFVVFAWCV